MSRPSSSPIVGPAIGSDEVTRLNCVPANRPVGLRILPTRTSRPPSPRPLSRHRSDPLGHDELLAATAHELRLPLSHIKGFVSSLRRTDVSWDEHTRTQFLAEIETETDRLTQMLESLLEMRHASRQPAGGGALPRVSPAAVVRGGLHRVRGLVEGRPIRQRVQADLPALPMDASGMERVIANLLQNAIKYSPASTPIGISARMTATRELEFSVEDHGPGVPVESRARIFEPFYRTRTHAEAKVPGHGLGLAICQRIVREHGGRIEVTDRPGGGARFSVFLPVSSGPDRLSAAKKEG
jgi:two-component system, OmpR family, sensor histidine kinase KdpD